MSRYPLPLKHGTTVDWTKGVLSVIGADGKNGIQPFRKKGLTQNL